MQNVVTIDTLDPNQKQVVFSQSAWLNLRKIGDTQYRFVRLEAGQFQPKQAPAAAPKATQSGCACKGKK